MITPFTYDITRTWEENCAAGPRFAAEIPAVPETPMKSFLGLPVRSRIGIAAGLLLNSRWIGPYAKRGYDLLTYKTVRSLARPCYPLPNWVFVEDVEPPDGPVFATDALPENLADLSSSVCFGMPSVSPEEWRADIQRVGSGLGAGQVLIVSVVGTPAEGGSIEALAQDFARCAAWAAEAGAHVIEANLSCPNVCSREGTLYQDASASAIVVRRIRNAIRNTPLLIKTGTFAEESALRSFLCGMDGLADGITLVNCISRPVLRRDGQPVFGPRFRTAGVLGRAIHRPSVTAVCAARRLIEAEKLRLSVAAVGGAATVQDIADFFAAGADAVLCGSSPMYLPSLAAEAKRAQPKW